MGRQVRKRYFVNVDMESEDEFRPKYIEFLTDLMYTRCTDRFAKLLANHSVPTYEYSFEYRGQYSIVNLQGEQVDMGVAHGDDLQYIFNGIWGEELQMSPSDTKFTRNIFTPLLANFALPRHQQRVQDRLQALRHEGLPGGQAQVLVRDCPRHLHEEGEEGGKERRAVVFSSMLTFTFCLP